MGRATIGQHDIILIGDECSKFSDGFETINCGNIALCAEIKAAFIFPHHPLIGIQADRDLVPGFAQKGCHLIDQSGWQAAQW